MTFRETKGPNNLEPDFETYIADTDPDVITQGEDGVFGITDKIEKREVLIAQEIEKLRKDYLGNHDVSVDISKEINSILKTYEELSSTKNPGFKNILLGVIENKIKAVNQRLGINKSTDTENEN